MSNPVHPEKVLMDVRHCQKDENVACQAQTCNERWAKYVVEVGYNPTTRQWTRSRTYLCKRCCMQLLTLSDAIGVG